MTNKTSNFDPKVVPLFAHLRGADRSLLLLNGLIGACTVVTGAAMFSGFLALGQTMGPLEVLAAGLFTVLIAAALTYSVHGMMRVRSRTEKLAWVGMWLLCAIASVTLSYGMYFGLLSANSQTRSEVVVEANETIAALENFDNAFGQLAAAATTASDYSTQVETTERDKGGTCPDSTRPADGPRQRLRGDDAAKFADYAEHFAAQRKAIGTALQDARAAMAGYQPASHVAAMNRLRTAHNTALRVGEDVRIGQWQDWLAARTAAGKQPMVDALTGTTFLCPDSTLEAKMAGAAAVKLPKLAPFAEIEAPSHEQGVRRGVQLLTGEVSFNSRLDGLPLLLGALVDVLLLGLVRAKALLHHHPRRAGPVFNPSDPTPIRPGSSAAALLAMQHSASAPSTLGMIGRSLDAVMAEEVWIWLSVLKGWSTAAWRKTRFAVPDEDAAHPEARTLGMIASLLQLERVSTQRVGKLPKGRLREICLSKLPEDATVTIYQGPVNIIEELQRDWLRQALTEQANPMKPDASGGQSAAA